MIQLNIVNTIYKNIYCIFFSLHLRKKLTTKEFDWLLLGTLWFVKLQYF